MDLVRERALMTTRKGSDSVKEWKKILEFAFDETEKMPSDIDVSEYTEFFVSIENVTNKGTVKSNLNLNFGQVCVKMYTQPKGTKSMCQQAHLINNGLFLEQYVFPRCQSNGYIYDYTYSNITSPYTRKINPTLSPLVFRANTNNYNLISGTITIYAR